MEPRNLVILKTYNTEFDEIIITFTEQNGRRLEIDDKGNLILLIEMTRYSLELRTRKYIKDMDFCHSREICLTNMRKQYWRLLQKQD